ncbi:MAG: exodeoxyribonuclease VII small subunit [Erysipelotrichaceae bacterium]|nr:exodeoxyribonuclease VII small subunit [Erysipelotrichaceae bacterium]
MDNNQTFEQKMKRLNEIVSQLEKNEVPLEEMITVFEEGMKLVKECDEQLKSFEMKIKDISEEA